MRCRTPSEWTDTWSMPGMQERGRKCVGLRAGLQGTAMPYTARMARMPIRTSTLLNHYCLTWGREWCLAFSKADVKITLVTLICPAIRRRPQRPMTCRPTRRDIWRCTLEAVVAVALSDRQQWVDHCPTTGSSQRRAYPSLLRSHRGFAYNY